ncbi:hypothetical protein CPB86DRAFT_780077 [Serendipita vermifera]|nr:hypothetical protein CPB86DRAFT_780077 [Serendipita vermifera]
MMPTSTSSSRTTTTSSDSLNTMDPPRLYGQQADFDPLDQHFEHSKNGDNLDLAMNSTKQTPFQSNHSGEKATNSLTTLLHPIETSLDVRPRMPPSVQIPTFEEDGSLRSSDDSLGGDGKSGQIWERNPALDQGVLPRNNFNGQCPKEPCFLTNEVEGVEDVDIIPHDRAKELFEWCQKAWGVKELDLSQGNTLRLSIRHHEHYKNANLLLIPDEESLTEILVHNTRYSKVKSSLRVFNLHPFIPTDPFTITRISQTERTETVYKDPFEELQCIHLPNVHPFHVILQTYTVIRPVYDHKPEWWKYLTTDFYGSWARVRLAVNHWIGIAGPIPHIDLEPGKTYFGPWFDAMHGDEKNPLKATSSKQQRSSEYGDDQKDCKRKCHRTSGNDDEYHDTSCSQSSSEDESPFVIPFGSRHTFLRQRHRPYEEMKWDELNDVIRYC